ncbi:hypothetical protein FC41_GL001219 [Lactobacillus hominis DSM 23910 = CRBIP 24.179]|nr:hypothetical protein FC41_GL001219 [Lactobacillus hominis DSM 23910 = CRBIP 24.179]
MNKNTKNVIIPHIKLKFFEVNFACISHNRGAKKLPKINSENNGETAEINGNKNAPKLYRLKVFGALIQLVIVNNNIATAPSSQKLITDLKVIFLIRKTLPIKNAISTTNRFSKDCGIA